MHNEANHDSYIKYEQDREYESNPENRIEAKDTIDKIISELRKPPMYRLLVETKAGRIKRIKRDDRSVKILYMSVAYGCTYDEIGKEFGISRERVRQIRDATLKKMRRKLQ